ncbi:MAG: hypothetical protein ABIR94_23395 [Rubrivivax sp.]
MRFPIRWPTCCSTALLFLGSAAPFVQAQAPAQSASTAGIYTCIDDSGRKITADRPISECTAKNQRMLNRDGSLKAVFPPILTVEERAEKEARERTAAAERVAQADAVRRDRNLLARYPNEVPHRNAREAALNTVRAAIQARDRRLEDLALERAPLSVEAEFYKGRELPLNLRIQLDANDAAVSAQRQFAASQQAEFDRVNSLYDDELARLKRLWAGAMPGSLGPLPSERLPAVASSASSAKASNLR